MDVNEAILKRRPVRSYKNKDIPREKIERIMDSVRMAPSARNRQEWHFIIVKSQNVKDELCKSTKYKFIGEASVIIVAVSTDPDYVMSSDINAGIVDLSIALDHLSLKAVEEGLGTCWIGGFDQEVAKNALGVPDDQKIIALMSLGYPQDELDIRNKERKSLEKVISYDSY
ncbi:MAG: nitroreductase family protein [Candidatus Hadarchaeia archaeon]